MKVLMIGNGNQTKIEYLIWQEPTNYKQGFSSGLDLLGILAWHELGSELIDPRSLLLGLQVLQELYFLRIWSVLHQVLLHEPVAAPDDIAEHLLRAALANSGELLPHPLCVRLPQILDQQQRVPPLAFDPGPDRLDGVEVGRAGRQEFYDDSFLIEQVPNYFGAVGRVIIHHHDLVGEVEFAVKLREEMLDGGLAGRAGDVVEDDLHCLADGPNDGHVFLLLSGALNY